ncbi:MAG: methyltransferase [Halieaceae bacterium]|jgi:16S rRNA G1207 methylase RsmC|nr:methyltransferase [Halieaceae bacterium]
MTPGEPCHTPYGDFRLARYPARRDEPLQAWCAADLLLLDEIHRLGTPGADILVANDEHGALCVALQPRELWTDSALTALALQHNLARNQLAPVPVTWSTGRPRAGAALVALRIPKQLPYFQYQLAVLSRLLEPGATVLAAGMDKHLSPRVAALLEDYIGPAERHRGQRKARLFSARRDDRTGPAVAPPASYYCEALAGELRSQPNVFSQDRLDGGSRLLLDQLRSLQPASLVIDLACGNGVLGLSAFRQGLASQVLFADESAMAIASAQGNAARLFPADTAGFAFHQDDGLAHYAGPAAGLILCNPPFHLNHAVDDYAGRRLLEQCAGHLQPGGSLCIVANQHLDYLPTLRRHFGTVDRLARDRRFIVWLARRD